MLGYKRSDRVGDQIRLEIADILSRRMKDPRVGFVTLTTVDVTADLKQAWVYVTVLQEGAQANEAIATLGRATGFIRGELGRRLKLRYVPELRFVRDTSVDQVRKVMTLLDEVTGQGTRPGASGPWEKRPVSAGRGREGEVAGATDPDPASSGEGR
jgi:ribosome-binding factor A